MLLAGPYYFDVDMVNSLPNMARQLGRRGMVRETSLQALSKLCSERDSVLKDIVELYRLVDATAQAVGVTARDRAKDLPIRILHGGGHAAWLEAQGLQASHPTLPLVAQLEAELRVCRREVYAYVQRHMTRRGYGGWRTTCVGQRRCGRVLGLWRGRRRRRCR